MARLKTMPPVSISQGELAGFGAHWIARRDAHAGKKGSLSRTPPFSSGQLGQLFDEAVGKALSVMLGGIPIVKPNPNRLVASEPDCVEVGPVRVVGGVRPQNFDVGYRPDGVRFAFDSKTLNDSASVGKNWQNMINDLATEATTVHSRFPHAVVAFMVVCPEPCINGPQRSALIETLERLGRRLNVGDAPFLAEAIAFVVWRPEDGSILADTPAPESHLRLKRFSEQVEAAYVSRYKGLPPHAVDSGETETVGDA